MGGGGVMRAALKVASVGAINSGLRGVGGGGGQVMPDQPFSAAARGATRPVSAILSSASGKVEAAAAQAAPRPLCEIDDWEFAGGNEDLVAEIDNPVPRLVFGGAPTLEEAKSATNDLKDALEGTNWLALNSAGRISPATMSHESAQSQQSNSIGVKPCITLSTENHAVQAFKLLKESPATQSVVASIASDPNVWDAVMQNEALNEFLLSHKTSMAYSVNDLNEAESVADNGNSCDANQSEKTKTGFMNIMENVKNSISDMVNKASDFLKNSAGIFSSECKATDPPFSSKDIFQNSIGASLLALAVTVIMVVVMKRV